MRSTWVFDEFHTVDSRSKDSFSISQGTPASNTLLKVLDGQRCRLYKTEGGFFHKTKNVPVVYIANEIPRFIKEEMLFEEGAAFMERLHIIRFQSHNEILREEKVIATLNGCIQRRKEQMLLTKGNVEVSICCNDYRVQVANVREDRRYKSYIIRDERVIGEFYREPEPVLNPFIVHPRVIQRYTLELQLHQRQIQSISKNEFTPMDFAFVPLRGNPGSNIPEFHPDGHTLFRKRMGGPMHIFQKDGLLFAVHPLIGIEIDESGQRRTWPFKKVIHQNEVEPPEDGEILTASRGLMVLKWDEKSLILTLKRSGAVVLLIIEIALILFLSLLLVSQTSNHNLS